MEQIVAAPGTVKRIAVGVLLQSAQDARTIEQVRQLVGVAAGLSPERGDSVVVFARDRFAAPEQTGAALAPRPVSGAAGDIAQSPAPTTRIAVASHAPHTASMGSWGLLALLVIVLSIALPYWWLRRQSDETLPMNSEQRERKLEQLRRVLARDGAAVDA
jgi:flagellar M-ring protein FliF